MKVDTGLGDAFGWMGAVEKKIWICVGGLGAGAHSLGISRAHYSFESLFYPALTLSLYIYIYTYIMWKQKIFTSNPQRRQMFPHGKGSFQMTDIAKHTF